jgi:hypothetical protein
MLLRSDTVTHDAPLDDRLSALLAKLEAESPQLEYSFELRGKFSPLTDSVDFSTPSLAHQQLRWEYNLFAMHLKNRFESGGLKVSRFNPMFTDSEGRGAPDPRGFPPDAIPYFEQRIAACKSPLMRARYCDFLWEHSDLKDKYKYARQAVHDYIDTLAVHQNPDAVEVRVDALQRSADLALTLDPRKGPRWLSAEVAAAIRKELAIADVGKSPRWLLDVITLALALTKEFTTEDWGNMVTACDTAIRHFEDEGDFLSVQSYLELKPELYRMLGRDHSEMHSIRILQAESYLREAEGRSRRLEQAMFLESAIKAFLDIGEKERAEALIAQMKEATEYGAKYEMGRIPIPLDYDETAYKSLKEEVGVGASYLDHLAYNPSLHPNWEAAVESAADIAKSFPLLGMLGGSLIGRLGYTVRHSETNEEITEDNVMQAFGLSNLMKLQIISRLTIELIQSKQLHKRDFRRLFKTIALIDPALSETIAHGIDRFFHKDYLSALYILTIQLEDYLRQLLYQLGHQTTVYKHSTSAFQEKTLEPILRGLKEYLSESLYRYIVWVLDDDRGFHLRDHLAHGFIKKRDADLARVMAVIHIIVLLTLRLKIQAKPKDAIERQEE